MNPLTPEEIAKLPKPGTTANDNRPSSFGNFAPDLRETETCPPDRSREAAISWVEQVSRERIDQYLVVSVQLRDSDVSLGPIGMEFGANWKLVTTDVSSHSESDSWIQLDAVGYSWTILNHLK